MKLVFCSSIYNMDEYEKLKSQSKSPLTLADHNLNYNIVRGLEQVIGESIPLVNNVQIPSWPKFPNIFFHDQIWHHNDSSVNDVNCGFINFPILKHLSRAWSTYSKLKEFIQLADTDTPIVITYDLHLGATIGILMAKRIYPSIKTCLVMPDVPTAVLSAEKNKRRKLKNSVWAETKMKLIECFDSYVFLTEHMNDVINKAEKPYTVLEGIYDNRQQPLPAPTSNKKVILYSGLLNPAYGIDILLEAFIDIYKESSCYELWLCGYGPAVDRINEEAEKCPGIKYFGYVGPETVRKLQSEAIVLVNPRQNIGDLTRYSFPSKTMEYLASGRIVVGYKLDGIPDEYSPHIMYVDDDSVEALKRTLINACNLPIDERMKKGEAARSFILNSKNPHAMCKRVVDMFEHNTWI